MKVNLLYGRTGKIIELPDELTTVVKAGEVKPVANERDAVRDALRSPIGRPALKELVKISDEVVIVFSDITRPMPYNNILPPLLEELDHVPDNQIVFINATGTHRSNTKDELVEILGDGIVGRFTIVQHDCRAEDDLVCAGNSSRGHEIWINRRYMQSSVRILTGFIEPHLFAGFSGGPKAVLPGIAGERMIYANHSAEMIGHPGSDFACTAGNPIWEEMLEAALLTEPTFILNVTQTEDRKITGVFAGDLEQAHAAGVEFVRQSSLVPVPHRYDIVISTAGGYPMDISMYQSVKGMAVTKNVVKDGGAVILVCECEEGLPGYGEYRDIIRLADSPEDILEIIHKPDFIMQDQWDVQIQAQLCKKVNFFIHSGGISDSEIVHALGRPCHDIEDTVEELLSHFGSDARIAVLPAGPLVVPYLLGEQDLT